MLRKRLLFLTKDLLTAFPWAKGSVAGPPQRFTHDDAGRAAFARYIATDPRLPVYLMVDLVEEEFRNETMPHVYGPDRKALVERRLARAFSGTPYRHLEIQGREKKKGRRDDLTVLIGITEPDIVTPWVEILKEQKASFAGIYSLPMVSAPLLKILDVLSPATLVVSWQSTSGLRFSFFDGRHLKISRMAPVPDPDPEKYASLFVSELERTRGYLNSLRLVPRDTPLQVVLFTSPEMLDAVRPRCVEGATIRFRLMTVNVVARKLGIKRRISTPFSDSLFIQLLGRRTPGNHFAPPGTNRFFLSRLLRSALLAASVLLVLGGVIGGGYALNQGWTTLRAWQDAKARADDLYARYRGVIDQHLPTSIDPSDVKNAVALIDSLQGRRASPREMMVTLSQGLEAYPALRLDGFEWHGPESSGLAVAVKAVPERRGRGRNLLAGEPPPPQTLVLESAVITGKVLDIKDNLEYALGQVNGFMGALLKNPQVHQVTPLVVPKTRVEAREVLSGDALNIKKEVREEADFSFRVVLKRPGGGDVR